MDDFLDSFSSLKEASHRISEVKEISEHANWETHGWASNYARILGDISNVNNSNQPCKMTNELEAEKVLRLQWLNVTVKKRIFKCDYVHF